MKSTGIGFTPVGHYIAVAVPKSVYPDAVENKSGIGKRAILNKSQWITQVNEKSGPALEKSVVVAATGKDVEMCGVNDWIQVTPTARPIIIEMPNIEEKPSVIIGDNGEDSACPLLYWVFRETDVVIVMDKD